MTLGDQLQELLDRQAIADCVQRYARGIDRQDVDLVASCYHPDAIDDHGSFVGSGRELAEWAFERKKRELTSQNHVTTHNVELNGDTAHGETYYLSMGRDTSGVVRFASGRYIDRFERRNGEWRIAERLCIVESVTKAQGEGTTHRPHAPSTRDQSDPSYQRPLVVRTSPHNPYKPPTLAS
jgi:ketosteroid isomerase-like protein